jgi:hypothetical protein
MTLATRRIPARKFSGGLVITGGDSSEFLELADEILDETARFVHERVTEPLLAAGKTPVIPPKSNRKTPRHFDKEMSGCTTLQERFSFHS